jgi:hypothetical protein
MTQAQCETELKKCAKFSEDAAAVQTQADINANAQQGIFNKIRAGLGGNCPAVYGHIKANECYKEIKDASCVKKAQDGYRAAVKDASDARTACYTGANTANQLQPGSGDQALQEAGLSPTDDGLGGEVDTASQPPVEPATAPAATPTEPNDPNQKGLLGKTGDFLGKHPLMTMLGAGALGTYLGMKLSGNDDDKDKDDDADTKHALLPNGNVDCSVAEESYKYAGCIPNMINQCQTISMNPALAAGVDKDVAKSCTDFQAAYCNTTTFQAGNVETVQVEGNPMPIPVPMLGVGEGRSSDFCKTTAATNFCKTPGMDQCPSCLNLAAKQSPACAADQTLCMAQNSPAQLAKALNACPGADPMKTDPAVIAMLNMVPTTNNQFSGVAGSGGGASEPTVVLPQSVGTGKATRSFASQSVGPTADIGAQHGVSAHVLSSAAIQNLCSRGKLSHCR